MIFSSQRFLEDYFNHRNYSDTDQYAVAIANQFVRYRSTDSLEEFLARLRCIHTIFYKLNRGVDREFLLKTLVALLDQKFKGKVGGIDSTEYFPQAAVRTQRTRLRQLKRRSIREVLESFRRVTQARVVDTFWDSRKALKLRDRPEKIAQAMLSQFLSGVLTNAPGRLFRELYSGIGFIDIVVMFGTVPHLVELKVQKGKFNGPAQLENYMLNESRREGWLVIFDARDQSMKTAIPETIQKPSGTIRVIVIDINPIAPCRLKE
jgi:hypothetical protein